MNNTRVYLLSLAAFSLIIVLAYGFIDRPLAFWAHEHLSRYEIFDRMTLLTGWFPSIAVAVIIALGLWSLTGRALPTPAEAVLLSSLSLIVARASKDQLKVVFGRTWPETWTNNNPSLIRDGAFGFNPFHGGLGFESFPSGHTTGICAVVTVLWLYYPKYLALYALPIAVVSVGLIGANYHFLSDIVAGCFVGASIAVFCVSLYRNGTSTLGSPGDSNAIEGVKLKLHPLSDSAEADQSKRSEPK